MIRALAAKKKRRSKPDGSPSFEELGLSALTLEALRVAGYEEPTPIQAGMIPKAIDGIDLIGQARTGTGKTAAFAIPIIEVLETHRGKSPRALILVPTRELAVQVRDEVLKLAHGRRLNCVAVYGGKPIREPDRETAARGRRDRGHARPRARPHEPPDARSERTGIRRARRSRSHAGYRLPPRHREDPAPVSVRSADAAAERHGAAADRALGPTLHVSNRRSLDFSPTDISVETIEQSYFTVEHGRKFELLVRLLARENPQQAIVFCRTKRRTESLFRRLSKHIEHAACIHGDMSQSNRDRVMERFRAGKIRCLIATDVVGRGIDVTSISHIINFDTPQFCDDYVHRVGRTGRMGREGVAFTFVAPEEGPELTRIEQRINRQLKRDEISGFECGVAATRPAVGRPTDDDWRDARRHPAAPLRHRRPPPPFGRRGRRHRRAL